MKKFINTTKEAIVWWNDLPIYEKVAYKKAFNEFRIKPSVIKKNLPDMYDLKKQRISQFSDKHITKIWEFKDKIKA
jgi:hypothetical protein